MGGDNVGKKLQAWIVTANRGSATVDYLTEKLEPFFQRHPNIEIDWRLLSWSTAWVELIRAYKQGTPPDVFEFGTTWLSMFAHLGALSPVPEGLMDTTPVAPYILDASRFQGTMYSIPWLIDTSCFVARTDVLSRLGMDPGHRMDWHELREACVTIMDQRNASGDVLTGRFPKSMVFPCGPERVTLHRIFPWLWAGGFQIPDIGASEVSVLTSPDIRPGLAFVREIMRSSDMTAREAQSSPHNQNVAFYQEGATAFLLTGWHAMIRGIAEGYDVYDSKWPAAVMQMPRGPHGAFSFGGGSMLGVSSLTKHPDEAWALTRALNEPNLLTEWALWTGCPPAYPCVFWDKYQDLHAVKVLAQTMMEARTYPVHPIWSSFERTLAVGLGELLWYLVDHDYDDHARHVSKSVDAELNHWMQLTWEVQS